MNEKIYPKGMMMFPKHQNAPDFVIGTMIISLDQFFKFCKEQEVHQVEYKMKDGAVDKQLKFQLLDGDNGLYFKLDTYKRPTPGKPLPADLDEDDLPF